MFSVNGLRHNFKKVDQLWCTLSFRHQNFENPCYGSCPFHFIKKENMQYLRWQYTGFVTVTTEPSAITVSFPSFPAPRIYGTLYDSPLPWGACGVALPFCCHEGTISHIFIKELWPVEGDRAEFVQQHLSDKEASIVSLLSYSPSCCGPSIGFFSFSPSPL